MPDPDTQYTRPLVSLADDPNYKPWWRFTRTREDTFVERVNALWDLILSCAPQRQPALLPEHQMFEAMQFYGFFFPEYPTLSLKIRLKQTIGEDYDYAGSYHATYILLLEGNEDKQVIEQLNVYDTEKILLEKVKIYYERQSKLSCLNCAHVYLDIVKANTVIPYPYWHMGLWDCEKLLLPKGASLFNDTQKPEWACECSGFKYNRESEELYLKHRPSTWTKDG